MLLVRVSPRTRASERQHRNGSLDSWVPLPAHKDLLVRAGRWGARIPEFCSHCDPVVQSQVSHFPAPCLGFSIL